MVKFAFVILHYQTLQDTIECIDSIFNNMDSDDYKIIVVDNGSTNNSGDELLRRYKKSPQVKIIKSKKNLGFANGNNLGYKFAKEELKAKFILLINNDTVINQKNFTKKIEEKYKTTGFDILGPDIISLADNKHQNPQRTEGISKQELKKLIWHYRTRRLLNLLCIEEKIINIYFKLKKIAKKKEPSIEIRWAKEQHNVQLHGACLIFSPGYVKKFNGLYSKTFMYMEEDILYYISIREGLRILYTPEIKIFHKEDSSTNALFPDNNRNKRTFIYKNTIKSAKELIKLKKDFNKNFILQSLRDKIE
ncbi:glycosyltransferase [Heyndrickxia coagulans]|uniref:Glycosyltransferase 2-like domain-containing protein n=1 Tax=Heyndrickxia coagulans TaxID=1398 RepID=A0A150K4Y3_HEYCO|nr:glycosyltransferase family 2 protein [Heyndrickxia coagulans]KYC64650.1 hypothetical protein B4098_0879 [Heyndrickxia coagulans]